MTLDRRRKRLKMEEGGGGTPPNRLSSNQYAENELDDLIAVLKTGDYMANRRTRPPPSVPQRGKREVNSRDRPMSMVDTTTTTTFTGKH